MKTLLIESPIQMTFFADNLLEDVNYLKAPSIPDNESSRLDSLRDLNILDTPAEDRFDRITRIAKRSFGCSYAAINLVDEDRQWGKSTCGVKSTEGPRETSFCAHAILDEKTTIIPDTHEDDRFHDNPLVTGDPQIRFYMGHPVHSPEGYSIGTLCVFDPEPRDMVSENEEELILDLAMVVESELQRNKLHDVQSDLQEKLNAAQRRSRIDELTDLWNRRAIIEMLREECQRSFREEEEIGVSMVDIDDFKAVNDCFGHPAGDKVIKSVSETMRQSVRDYDAVARYGGEEFLVLLTEGDPKQVERITERIRRRIEEKTVDLESTEIDVTVSLGVTARELTEGVDPSDLIQEADEALYLSKNRGKNTVTFYSDF
ncbi:MAG: diguanylate cyclase [bacterium]